MKNLLISYSIRCVLGYLVIIILSYKLEGAYSYLVYLSNNHPIFLCASIFFLLTSLDAGVNWVKINIQLKGVGGKSRHHSNSIK